MFSRAAPGTPPPLARVPRRPIEPGAIRLAEDTARRELLAEGAVRSKCRHVQRLVDGMDTEACLAWAHEIAPDDVPSFEAWAHAERPE